MASCAFCSDENLGYVIILITKHIGILPSNHDRVGGIVATARHGHLWQGGWGTGWYHGEFNLVQQNSDGTSMRLEQAQEVVIKH